MIFAFAASGAALHSPDVWSQSAPKVDAAAKGESDKRIEEGKTAAKRGDAVTARIKFEQAHAIYPSPASTWNLALVDMDSDRPVEALRYFREYLADPRVPEKEKVEGRQYVKELWPRAGHLRIKLPAAAVVRVDGVLVENERLEEPVDVAPGRHKVVMATQQKDVEAPAGKEVVVQFEASPSTEERIPAPVLPPPHETRTYHSTAKIGTIAAVGGVGVASIVAGVLFVNAKHNAQDRINGFRSAQSSGACNAVPAPSFCSDLSSAVDDADADRTKANVFLSLGSAAIVGAGVLFFAWPKSTEERSTSQIGAVQVVPLVGPNAWSLTAAARF